MNLETVRTLIEKEGVHSIDLKYADLVGNWYHITFPARRLDHVLHNGIPFDGSSIPGMKSVEAGDMVLLPDPETTILDPFSPRPRLRMLSYICDADSRRGVNKDPRTVARRAQRFMVESGVADTSLWVPEFEFYLFNEATIDNGKYSAGYRFTSAENKDDLPGGYVDADGTAVAHRKGYHIDIPFDKYTEVREEMVRLIEGVGCPIRYHHHEVGLSGQQEIETELLPFELVTDRMMYVKDIVHNCALKHGLTATFMPKPLYDEPEFVVRNIWRLYGGWYDGNPANLHPLPPEAAAKKYVEYMGGAEAVLARAGELGQFDPAEASPLRAVRDVDVPIVFVHGREDRRVPPAHSEALHEAAHHPKKLLLIDGADHEQADQSARYDTSHVIPLSVIRSGDGNRRSGSEFGMSDEIDGGRLDRMRPAGQLGGS